MSVLRPRKRLVYFRVSEEEFQRLASVCHSAGARSISDLARTAVERFITTDGDHSLQPIDIRLRELDAIMLKLNQRLRKLSDVLSESVPPDEPRQAGTGDSEEYK